MPRLPLDHIRIVDLTQAWAGAYATQLLGDFGAEVIKVESRSRPDPWRGGFEAGLGLAIYPAEGAGVRPYNRSSLANSVNRNKAGITLDLNTTEGNRLFLELVQGADVVAENFTPRVMANLGLSYDRLQEVRPGIVLLSMPAYGGSGPYSDYPGIGGTIEPMSGNSWLLGETGGEPQVSGVMYPDAVAGIHGACGVMVALHRRNECGEGAHVEVSQQESMIGMLGEFFAQGSIERLGRLGNRDLEFVPNGIYRCLGDEQWLAISVRDDDDWRRFVACAGHAELAHDGFATKAQRRSREDELDGIISDWAATERRNDLEAKLLAAGVPAARVRSVGEVISCPQLAARDYFESVEQPDGIGPRTMPGIIAHLSMTPGEVRLPPAEHGKNSREVLARLLELDEETLDLLEAAGTIGEGPPP